MTVNVLSSPSVRRPVGDVWDILVSVEDADGVLVDAVPVVTVTLPSGTTDTPAVETISTGVYRVVYTVATAGRYTASVLAASYGVAEFAAYVEAVTGNAALPTVATCRAYDPDQLSSWSDTEVQDALDTEVSAQRRACKVLAVYPPDLAEAVKRRVQVNLAKRPLPLGVAQGDAEVGPIVLAANEAEVRRLERPYRKLVIG